MAIREAKDELVRISNDDSQRALYEAREKANKDRTSALAESRHEGIEEGKTGDSKTTAFYGDEYRCCYQSYRFNH